jgi:F-type H+-transporting ATPase subunit delta
LTDVVEGYAAALLEASRAEDAVEDVSNELFHFARAMERSDDLRQALTDQNLPVEKRQAIALELIGAKASPFSASLVSFIIASGRARHVVAIIDTFVERAAAEQDKEIAEIRSSVPLDADQQKRLAEVLSKSLGKQVEVKVVVEPGLLGGIVAKVGDTVIDGSVRHRLDQLRETI